MTLSFRIFVMLFSVLLFFASLWGGSYLCFVLFPFGHWANFPAFFTAFALLIMSGALFAFAAIPGGSNASN